MKRDDVKAKFPNMTDEEIQWLMDQHGASLTREQAKVTAIQAQLDTANAQLKTAQDGLKAFEGVNVDELRGQITKLQNDLTAQAEAHAFDSELDTAIRTANGKNTKAIRGMLDVEALRSSKNRAEDIKSALEALVKSDPWAFGAAAPASPPAAGGMTVQTGGGHGDGGGAGDTLFGEISAALFPQTTN